MCVADIIMHEVVRIACFLQTNKDYETQTP